MGFLIMLAGCAAWASLTGSVGQPMFGSFTGFLLNAVPSALWGWFVRDMIETIRTLRNHS